MHHMEVFPHEPQRRLLPNVISTLPVSLPLFPAFFLASHNICYSRERVLLHPCDPAKESRAALKKARVKRARSSRKYKCLLTWRASDTTLTSVTGTFQPFVCFSRICCSCAALTTWLVCSRIAAVAPPCSYTRLHAPVVHHTTQPKNNFLLAANWIRQVSRRREAQERPDLLTYFSGLSFLWALQGPLSNPSVSSITGHVWTANCDYSGRPGVCQLQGGVSLWGWLDRHLQ